MIVNPVFIIGCPRSGTTLLFNILSESPELHSTGYEGGPIWEKYHPPSKKGWRDGSLDARDVTPESKEAILREFERGAASGRLWRRTNRIRSAIRRNPLWQRIRGGKGAVNVSSTARTANRFQHASLHAVQSLVRITNDLRSILGRERSIRLLEKTPENCLRLPFLREIFPDALFLYLIRDGRANTYSLMEGWRHFRREAGYQVPLPLHIKGYAGRTWKFTLIPGWQDLVDSPLEVVCAHQWVACNQAVLAYRDDWEAEGRMMTVRYEDLVTDPLPTLQRICDFCRIASDPFFEFQKGLPVVNAVSRPRMDKWRDEAPEAIARVWPLLEPTMKALGYETEPMGSVTDGSQDHHAPSLSSASTAPPDRD